MMIKAADHVQHARFGAGIALVADAETVIVQFDHGIERCRLHERCSARMESNRICTHLESIVSAFIAKVTLVLCI